MSVDPGLDRPARNRDPTGRDPSRTYGRRRVGHRRADSGNPTRTSHDPPFRGWL